jgi:hypothetical protein
MEMVSVTLRPLYPLQGTIEPIEKEAGWGLRAAVDILEKT